MIKLSEDIVEEAVKNQQEVGMGLTVDRFGEAVEDDVKETVEPLQESTNAELNAVAGEAMEQAKSYHEERNELLDPEATVEHAKEERGAAAYVEMNSRQMTFDADAMNADLGALESYWERVKIHELVHQEDQAGQYDAEDVQYFDRSGELKTATVVGNMTERQAIRKARQPNGDLTPDYIEHAEIGDDVAEITGEAAFDASLAPGGSVQDLQAAIIQEQKSQFIEMMLQGEPSAVELN